MKIEQENLSLEKAMNLEPRDIVIEMETGRELVVEFVRPETFISRGGVWCGNGEPHPPNQFVGFAQAEEVTGVTICCEDCELSIV